MKLDISLEAGGIQLDREDDNIAYIGGKGRGNRRRAYGVESLL